MRHPENLPDKETAGYQLLELVAISGELPADQLRRLPGGDAYKLNVVRALKSKKLLRTYYRNGLRGYRLTSSAKEALLWENPARFSFSLTGASETNLVKSEITRRLRLHRVAEATVPHTELIGNLVKSFFIKNPRQNNIAFFFFDLSHSMSQCVVVRKCFYVIVIF